MWTVTGNVCFQLSQLLLLSAIAWFDGEAGVGRYGLALAVTAPVFMFASLQFRTLLAADTGGEFTFADYMTVRMLGTPVVFAVVAGAAFFTTPNETLLVLVVGLSKAVESISDVCYGLFWRESKMNLIARSMILRSLIGVALALGAIAAGWGVAAGVIGLSIGWAAVLLAHDTPAVLALCPPGARLVSIRLGVARRLVWMGLPAGLLSWLTSMQTSVPRLFVQSSLGYEAVGVLTCLTYALSGIEVVARAANHAAIPRMARDIAAGASRRLVRLATRLALLGTLAGGCIAVAAAFVGGPLLGVVFGPGMREHNGLLVALTLFAAARMAVMPLAMTARASRNYVDLCAVQTASLAATALGCAVLVPRHGLYGCVGALLAGLCVESVGRGRLFRSLLRRMTVDPTSAEEAPRLAA